MNLTQVTKELIKIGMEKNKLSADYQKNLENLNDRVRELKEAEYLLLNDVNVNQVELAESVLYVHGNPFGQTDGSVMVIADAAISDIAEGAKHLKIEFFGNKRYSGFYQRCDCSYGYGPKHGGVVDEIGLKRHVRERDLTEEESNACIYYLRNYKKISEAKKVANAS